MNSVIALPTHIELWQSYTRHGTKTQQSIKMGTNQNQTSILLSKVYLMLYINLKCKKSYYRRSFQNPYTSGAPTVLDVNSCVVFDTRVLNIP